MQAPDSFKHLLQKMVSISDKDFEKSMEKFESVRLKKGDYFVKSGAVCTQAAFIINGALRMFYLSEKGEEVTQCFCVDNHLTTSFKSFITQSPSAISVQALVDSELLVISHSALQQLYQQVPIWQSIGRLFIEKEYLSVEKYAGTLNSESAKEKYLRLLKEQPAVLQLAPLQHIASYLGVSRETLSRIRKQVLS